MRPPATVLVSLLAAGCGRLLFDEARGADAGATPGDVAATDADAGPACDPSAPFGAPVLISSLSDPAAADGTLRLLADELSGYFWSQRGGSASTIYLATRPDRQAPFTVSTVQGINAAGSNLDPTLSPDGTLLVFRRNSPGDDLYRATRTAPETFAGAAAITSVNTGSTEAQAYFQPDGDELVFQSMRSGNGDLYRAAVVGETFAAPTVIAELATADEEGDPVVSFDGLTLYFRSNAPAALGGFNIHVTTRATPDGTFGAPVLVPNVNAGTDDGPSWVSADGCRLYLSSDRAGTNDIYVATRGT